VEGPAHERLADAFVGFGDAGARHARFFVPEVEREAAAGEEEEEAGLPGEGLGKEKRLSVGNVGGGEKRENAYAETVFRFGFFDGFVGSAVAEGESSRNGLLGGDSWGWRGGDDAGAHSEVMICGG
jgi:hypothetical protein